MRRYGRFAFRMGAWGWLFSSVVWAQTRKPEDLAMGKLLVAPRESPDPAFAKSVVLLIQYGQGGVVGLIVNRQTTVSISRAIHDVKGSANRSDPMFIGGPVEPSGIVALFRSVNKLEGAARVLENIYLATSSPALESALSAGTNPAEVRLFAGYCGWAEGQLEFEVRRGGWYIFNRSADAVFDSNPSTLWSRLVEQAEVRIASGYRRRLPAGARPERP